MDVYEAVSLMRGLTKKGLVFSLEFYGHDESKFRFTGEKHVGTCLLRSDNEADKNSDYKLALLDVAKDEPKSCWIPLITAVNGIKVITP